MTGYHYAWKLRNPHRILVGWMNRPFFLWKGQILFSVLLHLIIIQFILKFTCRCVEFKILIQLSTKLPTVLSCPFKDGMPRNAWHLMMLCTMNGCSHMPQHSSKNWGGLHQKLPAVSSNSIGECLKQNPQLWRSSSTHFTGCTGARNVDLNYCLQEMPTRQNQVKVSPPMVLPNWS